MSLPELNDERLLELARELRAGRPEAPAALRERVQALAEAEPELEAPAPVRRPRFAWLVWRRAAYVLVPVAGAVLLAIALPRLAPDGGGDDLEAGGAPAVAEESGADAGGGRSAPKDSADESSTAVPFSMEPATVERDGAAIPPSGNRLQDYRADMTIHVPDLAALSQRTTQAMRIARNAGGFVVTLDYSAPPGEEGLSRLVVRVPVSKVQQTILRYSELGTILSQQVSIQDLQASANRQDDRIASLQGTIRRLETQLRDTTLTAEARAALQVRLADARTQLRAANAQRETTERQGRLARIGLTLTTQEADELVEPPGENESRLRDALDVLVAGFVWALVVLIFAAPFLLLAAIVFFAARAGRRRSERRLLERS
jgi:hypothetical protein